MQSGIQPLCLFAFLSDGLIACLHNNGEDRIYQCEKRPKVKLGKQQRTLAVKSKYVVEKIHLFLV
jgi:hypothetical protein